MNVWLLRCCFIVCTFCLTFSSAYAHVSKDSSKRAKATKRQHTSLSPLLVPELRPYQGFLRYGSSLQLRLKAPLDTLSSNPSTSKSKALRRVADASKKLQGRVTQKKDDDSCNVLCQELIARTLFFAALDFDKIGKREIAYRYLQRLVRKYPSSTVAARARELQAMWKGGLVSKLDHSGRVEFVVFTSFYGIVVGGLAPLALRVGVQAPGPIAFGLSILGITGAAVAASTLLTARNSMSSGTASLTWNGTFWGTWNLFALAVVAGANGDTTLRLSLLGSLVGYGLGLGLGAALKPTAGMSFLAGSMGGWLAGYTAATIGIMSSRGIRIDLRPAFLVILLVSDAAFVAGLLAQPHLKFSRTRILLLNLGAAVGAGAGVGIALLGAQGLSNGSDVATLFLTSSLLMSIAGVVTAFFLTRGMAPEKDSVHIASGALFHLKDGRWSLDLPMPMVTPTDSTLGGKSGVQVSVSLASGTW